MPPSLILNADDFGLTPGINRAVVELHRAGVLTSATLMANGSAFDDAVRLAHANPTLGVGCHLVFVDGEPVSHPWDIPTLLGADGKTFRPSIADFMQAAIRGTIRSEDLAREAQAQIQRLQRAGIDVTHVDTHKHTHIAPLVGRTILDIAQRCGVPTLRNPFEPAWSAALAHAPILRRAQLSVLNRFQPSFNFHTQPLRIEGLLPKGTLGIAATGTLTPGTLRNMLDHLLTLPETDGSYELCCHPGYVDEALDRHATRLRTTREAEYRALQTVVPQYSRSGTPLPLIHYGNLGIAGQQRATGHFAPYNGYEKVL